MKIAISGSGGIGKTTLGRALAERLHLPFLEENLEPLVRAGAELHRRKQGAAASADVAASENNYLAAVDAWLADRQHQQESHPDGFVADRWALDILQRWLLGGRSEDDAKTAALIRHVRAQANRLDLVIVPPMLRLRDETDNEAGLRRISALGPRLLSHALYCGLLEQLTQVPRLYLAARPTTVEQRVEQVLATIERLNRARGSALPDAAQPARANRQETP